MANELKHGSVGTELTQAEWEGIGTHVVANQAIGDLIYASSTSQLRRLGISGTGTYILSISGGVPVWAAPAAAAAGSLTGSTLASGVTASSLTSVGTIATGVWQGTDVGVAYGGTGVSTLTSNAVLTGNGASAITAEANLTFDGSTLTVTADVIIAGTTPTLTIGDGGAENTALVFDGNEVDFHIGLQDSSNDLLFGTGASVGSGRMMMLGDAVGGTDQINRLTIDDAAVTLTEAAGAAYRALFLNMGNITLTSGTTVNNDGFSFLYIDKATLLATGGSVTVSEVNVLGIDIPTMASSTTGTAVAGIRIKDAGSVAGTMTTQYGIVIETLTAGATDVGIDMGNNTLENVGASGNDWTQNDLTLAGGTSTQTLQVGDATNPDDARIILTTKAGAAGENSIIFTEGSGNGDSNNNSYKLRYNTSTGRIEFSTQDSDGGSTAADIYRIPDGQTTIDANATWDDNVFDDHDDAMVLSPYREGILNLRARNDELIRIGVLRRYEDGWVGYSDQRMAALLAGGIYQNRHRMDAQHDAMDERLARIEAAIGV